MLDALSMREVERVLDYLPCSPFFIKDEVLRYVGFNTAMLDLCGLKQRDDLIGRTAGDVFPPQATSRYEEMERRVLQTGKPIRDRLELVKSLRGAPVWLLFGRWPVTGGGNKIVAVVTIARRVDVPNRRDPTYLRVSKAVQLMQEHFAQPFNIASLAQASGVSLAQFERDFTRVMGVSPRRYLIKARFDAAVDMLDSDASIAEIAHICGYKDHSAFSRQFLATFGTSPSAHRRAQQK